MELVEVKQALEEVAKKMAENHTFAGGKFTSTTKILDSILGKILPLRVKALEDHQDLIEFKYKGVHLEVARNLKNLGFEECLVAFISRGLFQERIMKDESFMNLVRDKASLHCCINSYHAEKRRMMNSIRHAEREAHWGAGKLHQGRVLPDFKPSITPGRGSFHQNWVSNARRTTTMIASEKEKDTMKWAAKGEEAGMRKSHPGVVSGAGPSTWTRAPDVLSKGARAPGDSSATNLLK